MRHQQSTLKASSVHAHARALLVEEMEMRDYSPSRSASLAVSILLLAACTVVKDPPCRETLRQAILACLPPKPSSLVLSLLRALRRSLPDHLPRLPQIGRSLVSLACASG